MLLVNHPHREVSGGAVSQLIYLALKLIQTIPIYFKIQFLYARFLLFLRISAKIVLKDKGVKSLV